MDKVGIEPTCPKKEGYSLLSPPPAQLIHIVILHYHNNFLLSTVIWGEGPDLNRHFLDSQSRALTNYATDTIVNIIFRTIILSIVSRGADFTAHSPYRAPVRKPSY